MAAATRKLVCLIWLKHFFPISLLLFIIIFAENWIVIVTVTFSIFFTVVHYSSKAEASPKTKRLTAAVPTQFRYIVLNLQ